MSIAIMLAAFAITPEAREVLKNFNFNNVVYSLLHEEPFFAAFSRYITKKSDLGIETLGVKINDWGYFELYYNPLYVHGLTPAQQKGALMHEYYHCILDHLTSRAPFPMTDRSQEVMVLRKIWNYATDLAINSLLPSDSIHEAWLLPGRNPLNTMKAKEREEVPESTRKIFELIESFPVGKESEFYYHKLLEIKEEFQKQMQEEGQGSEGEGQESESEGQGQGKGKGKGKGKGAGQFDDHSSWSGKEAGELSKDAEAAREMAKENLRATMEAASNEAAGRNWGTVSDAMRKTILERIRGVVDWRKVLRWFCNASIKADRYNSIRKINKRYPYIHAGKRNTRTANIAVSIDQSGSVSDQLLIAFYAELDNLSQFVTFTVIPFDSSVGVDKVFTWKKGERRDWERVLCGGTDFDAPTAYVNEHREFDAHIILTDMCAPKPEHSRCPRIWMTDEENASKPYFDPSPERIVAITNRTRS